MRSMSVKKILRLAIPVASSHMLLMTMGLVDLVFMRYVGTTATGAVGISSALFGWMLTIGIGLLAGMDYFVSTSFGAGKPAECNRYLGQGLWLAGVCGVPLTVLLLFVARHLNWFGIHPLVVTASSSFMTILAWGLVPVFVFGACRNYLQAVSRPLIPLIVLILANLLNLALNYGFIFGALGLPRLGADGCALSTTFCRVFMATSVLTYVLVQLKRDGHALKRHHLRYSSDYFKRLMALGIPASMQMILEMGVFGLSTIIAGRLDPESLAAHQIVLNIASTTFMVPLGIGAAAAVLVGQALGAKQPGEAARMGWLGLGIATVFMFLAGIVLIAAPSVVLKNFTPDTTVLHLAISLLIIAAVFQVSDGMQTALTGALRGLGDTRSAVVANFVGHWVIGLPVSLYLCFGLGWGVRGIWMGLATGLFLVAIALIFTWTHRLRQGHFRLEHFAR